jgi:hypothetical protein
MHDHFGVLKEWFIQSPYLLTMFGFITGFFMFAHNTTVHLEIIIRFKDVPLKILKEMLLEI